MKTYKPMFSDYSWTPSVTSDADVAAGLDALNSYYDDGSGASEGGIGGAIAGLGGTIAGGVGANYVSGLLGGGGASAALSGGGGGTAAGLAAGGLPPAAPTVLGANFVGAGTPATTATAATPGLGAMASGIGATFAIPILASMLVPKLPGFNKSSRAGNIKYTKNKLNKLTGMSFEGPRPNLDYNDPKVKAVYDAAMEIVPEVTPQVFDDPILQHINRGFAQRQPLTQILSGRSEKSDRRPLFSDAFLKAQEDKSANFVDQEIASYFVDAALKDAKDSAEAIQNLTSMAEKAGYKKKEKK